MLKIMMMLLIGIGLGFQSALGNQPPVTQLDSKIDMPEASPGYSFDTDGGIFRINTGAFSRKNILFATAADPRSEKFSLPKFVIADGKKIIFQESLPTLEESWNVVSVTALAAAQLEGPNGSLRIYAIFTIEPGSQRESEYWTQPFVFDLKQDGSVDMNPSLNLKLSQKKPRIETIKSLKAFLRTIT